MALSSVCFRIAKYGEVKAIVHYDVDPESLSDDVDRKHVRFVLTELE